MNEQRHQAWFGIAWGRSLQDMVSQRMFSVNPMTRQEAVRTFVQQFPGWHHYIVEPEAERVKVSNQPEHLASR